MGSPLTNIPSGTDTPAGNPSHHYYEEQEGGRRGRGRPSGYGSIELMKELGAPYYDPLPPDQHAWMVHPDREPLARIWSWLCHHTIAFGRRWPWAVDERGNELHVEHFAKDLGIEIANAYHYWKEGKELGVWKNGEPKAERKRLYLSGTVPARQVEGRKSGEQKPKSIGMYIPLPEYVLLKMKDFDEHQKAKVETMWRARQDVRRIALAEVVATVRMRLDQADDSAFSEFGLQLQRQGEKPRGTDGERAARATRQGELIAKGIDWYVHMVESYVQETPAGAHEPTVQPVEAGATLFNSEGGQNTEAAVGRTFEDGDCRGGKTPSQDGGKAGVHLHTPEKPLVSQPRPKKPAASAEAATATKATRQPPTHDETLAVSVFLADVKAMQKSFTSWTRFADPLVDEQDRGDAAWALDTVRLVGLTSIREYSAFVRWKIGLEETPSFGKLPRPRLTPAKTPHERFLGLIGSDWVEEWKRDAPERERRRRDAEKAKIFAAAAARAHKLREVEALVWLLDNAETAPEERDASRRKLVELCRAVEGDAAMTESERGAVQVFLQRYRQVGHD